MFTLPTDRQGKVVPYAGTDNCAVNGKPGPAGMGVALKSIPLPNGAVLWGKTGHDLGYANGVFATRDLSVRGAYSVATTSLDTAADAVSGRLLAAVITGK
jgi:D-alanyl-D-alanine carboxypeptidase